MSIERGKILLPIARAAIARALHVPHAADESAPWLAEHGACFVTLMQSGELRGCIGSLEAHRSLLEDVKNNAVSARAERNGRITPALDPRFDGKILELKTRRIANLHGVTAAIKNETLSHVSVGVSGIARQSAVIGSDLIKRAVSPLPPTECAWRRINTGWLRGGVKSGQQDRNSRRKPGEKIVE